MPEIIKLVAGTPQIASDEVHEWLSLDAAAASQGSNIALLLAPDDDPAAAAPLFARLARIAVQFPSATDGRGYSIAALLRTRYGWQGELRAVGEVLRDQLFYMRRVGFDAFAVAVGRDLADAMLGLSDFSGSYQASTTPAAPAFRSHPPGWARPTDAERAA